MNKLIPLLVSSVLLLGVVGCENAAKTSSDAANTTTESPKAPDPNSAKDTKDDATSQLRKDQLNSDIRANEQRNKAGGNEQNRAEGDLKSEVRSKLEANIPNSQLTVDATKDGAVTVAGTVPKPGDKAKIDGLAKQIKGVKTVKSDKVTVAAPASK